MWPEILKNGGTVKTLRKELSLFWLHARVKVGATYYAFNALASKPDDNSNYDSILSEILLVLQSPHRHPPNPAYSFPFVCPTLSLTISSAPYVLGSSSPALKVVPFSVPQWSVHAAVRIALQSFNTVLFPCFNPNCAHTIAQLFQLCGKLHSQDRPGPCH